MNNLKYNRVIKKEQAKVKSNAQKEIIMRKEINGVKKNNTMN